MSVQKFKYYLKYTVKIILNNTIRIYDFSVLQKEVEKQETLETKIFIQYTWLKYRSHYNYVQMCFWTVKSSWDMKLEKRFKGV